MGDISCDQWSVGQCVCVTIAADRVFDTHETTEEIHRELISPIIESVMNGIHGQYMSLLLLYYSQCQLHSCRRIICDAMFEGITCWLLKIGLGLTVQTLNPSISIACYCCQLSGMPQCWQACCAVIVGVCSFFALQNVLLSILLFLSYSSHWAKN